MENPAWALELTRALTRGRVLDVGCGEGRYLGPGAVGLDVDASRLRLARGRSRLVVAGDARRLPFLGGSFDTAYAHRVLNDTGDVDGSLAEIARVLKTEGQLLVFTRARPASGDRLDRWNGEERLRPHFADVRVQLHSSDERAAFFTARRPFRPPAR